MLIPPVGAFRLACPALLLVLAVVAVLLASPAERSRATDPLQWYRVDTHNHSVFSSDAFDDFGIITRAAKALNYNGIFLTDHNDASSFEISGLTANHMELKDSMRRWTAKSFGTPAGTTNEMVGSPVAEGTASLRLAATATSGYGETMVWTRRGPNLRSGDAIVKLSIRPTRIDPGTGVYVSASLGGDTSVTSADGYTTRDGVIVPGKSTVAVWQLGTPRLPSTDPNARVIVRSLGEPVLDQWTTYTINLSDALENIPAADLPRDYNAWTYLKIAAGGNGGTVDVNVDDVTIRASAPVEPKHEFAYANSIVGEHDTSSFRLIPAQEMGTRKHAQRLSFSSTDPEDFRSYYRGVDGIPAAQEAGYPAMLNHPGDDGGVESEEAINELGMGADLVEVRQDRYREVWDAILKQGRQILGAGGSDAHRVLSSNSFATYVRGGALTTDALAKSLFEGRTYAGLARFQGRLLFNLDGTDEPYPARYPVHVSPFTATSNVTLRVTGGLGAGSTVRWIRNGEVIATDSVSETTYSSTRSIDLSGESTYVRAEVYSPTGVLLALSQPIRFTDVPELDGPRTAQVTDISTSDGRGYTRLSTQGIVDPSWDGASARLRLPLRNPAGSVVKLSLRTDRAPTEVRVDGSPLAQASSASQVASATGSAWYYDGSAGIVHASVRHAATDAQLAVVYGGAADTTPPSTPAGLAVKAAGAYRTELTWSAATDDTGVTRYAIVRDGERVATVPTPATSYTDGTVQPDTLYRYAVEALDAAGNRSTPSDSVGVRTPKGTRATFAPVADAWIDTADPARHSGAGNSLFLSDHYTTYMRFDPRDLVGNVDRATLRVRGKTGSSIGFELRTSPDATWGEGTISAANAPPFSEQPIGQSGAVVADAWTELDVTDAVAPGTPVTFVLRRPTGNTTLALYSRESGVATAPQLVVESSEAAVDAPPTRPEDLTATAGVDTVDLAWSASTDDIAVDGYRVRRDGVVVGTIEGTSFRDVGLQPGTEHAYTVEAFDEAGNASDPTAPVRVTTQPVTRITAHPVADGYVDESQPATSFGSEPRLRLASAPVARGYIRFSVTGTTGPIHRALLRLTPRTASSTGFRVHGVADSTWTEAGLTYATAPAHAPTPELPSGPHGTKPVTVDVTPLVTGDGPVSFELDTAAGQPIDLASRESSAPPELLVESIGEAGPDQPPSVPTGLQASSRDDAITLSWSASTDDGKVNGYRVLRDGAPVGLVDGATLRYTDAGLAPDASYRYTVQAVDDAGQASAESAPRRATSAPIVTRTFAAVADAHVDEANPNTNYGASTSLKTDQTPVTRTFLRFDVRNLEGSVRKATLRTTPSSNLASGFNVRGVADSSWGERTITHANAPAVQPSPAFASGPAATNVRQSIDVTPLVTGNGPVSLQFDGTSATALRLASRESTTQPELVIEAYGEVVDDPPARPQGLAASATHETVDLSWTAATDDHGVAAYRVRRDGAPVGTVTSGTRFTDTGLQPDTRYEYTVQTVDDADQASAESEPLQVRTRTLLTSILRPAADGFVDETAPATSFGTDPLLRLSGAPARQSFLRFDLSGLTGPVQRARLRVTPRTASSTGMRIHAVTAHDWTEAGLTWSTAPPFATMPEVASGPHGTDVLTVDVTSLVTGGGPVSLQVDTAAGVAIDLGSRESSAPPELVVESVGDAPADAPPSVPAELRGSASADAIELRWSAATDDRAVDRYVVRRDGALAAEVAASALTYTDAGRAPDTEYAYTVQAIDDAGQASLETGGVTIRSRPIVTTTTTAVADAWVDEANPGTNYGTRVILRTDQTPVTRSFLKFDVGALAGPVRKATLTLTPASSLASGVSARGVSDSSWAEGTITHASAPGGRSATAVLSGGATNGTPMTIDVSPFVAGGGLTSLLLEGTSTTALSIHSRESAAPPRLTVESYG